MRTFHGFSAILLLLGACMIGGSARKYPPATGPAGATVKLEMEDKSRIEGELLSVDPASLMVLSKGELLRVSLAAIRRGSGPKVNFRGKTLPDATRNQLRLISRYPQGISTELEGRLVQAYEQNAVRGVP